MRTKNAEQIGKGFGQKICSPQSRRDAKREKHKADRKILRDPDISKMPKRYKGWVS